MREEEGQRNKILVLLCMCVWFFRCPKKDSGFVGREDGVGGKRSAGM